MPLIETCENIGGVGFTTLKSCCKVFLSYLWLFQLVLTIHNTLYRVWPFSHGYTVWLWAWNKGQKIPLFFCTRGYCNETSFFPNHIWCFWITPNHHVSWFWLWNEFSLSYTANVWTSLFYHSVGLPLENQHSWSVASTYGTFFC